MVPQTCERIRAKFGTAFRRADVLSCVIFWQSQLIYLQITLFSTALARKIKQFVATVRLSVRFIFWTDWRLKLSFCVWRITARLGLKVKVIGQGQTSMSNTHGRSNAVGLTSILDREQFFYHHYAANIRPIPTSGKFSHRNTCLASGLVVAPLTSAVFFTDCYYYY